MKKTLLLILLFSGGIVKAQTELVDFESAPVNVTIDSLTGCWEIGTPSKTFLDTAYSATHALMTDTINQYPDDQVSYAYFTFPESGMVIGYILTFQHKFDSELNIDGGYIQWYDCFSDTWNNIYPGTSPTCTYYMPGFNQNPPFSVLGNSEMGYSGNSSGWMTTQITFYCNVLSQGEETRGGSTDFQFRFAFYSDTSNTAQEGWMIDNIEWTSMGGFCSGIDEYKNELNLFVYPTQTSGELFFETENKAFSRITIYDFSGKQIESYTFFPTNFKTIELSKFANGMYFYSVDEGKSKGKFVIEK